MTGSWKGMRCEGGFSLIELLVVVVILIILMTLYWGSGSTSRERKTLAACQNNLQKMFMALQIYANDSSGKFPAVAGARTSEDGLGLLVPRYTVETTSFICPGTKDPPLPSSDPFRTARISYAYYMGRTAETTEPLMSDRQVNGQQKGAGQFVFSSNGDPPGNNHGKMGGNFLFCDGRAVSSPARAGFPLALPPGVVLLNPRP